MGEEVVKARLINREDADLLKLNFPKMRWAACSINGRASAYLADEVRAIRNRGDDFNRRHSLIPGQIIKSPPTPDDGISPKPLAHHLVSLFLCNSTWLFCSFDGLGSTSL
jgi:hypothetical protein